MTSSSPALVLRPIGRVRSPLGSHEHRRDYSQVTAEIIVEPEYAPALDGIERHSHIVVLFWFTGIEESERYVLQFPAERRKPDLPAGIFGTRAPTRPNPIGLTTVHLLGREGNVLRVSGLDAADGTPVLDLKPYSHWDFHPDATFPNRGHEH
ncbi:MAG: tRNA (N6-threonylcarbamoyladenosine(37)-N6)-methyltransferase TrmO [Chloroflexi bacterium]|nr:tRNA (N6-threonylcarbamoyladenosine(37)-N6)-methyltransferase TrmO [Chloroflexota bacterium]